MDSFNSIGSVIPSDSTYSSPFTGGASLPGAVKPDFRYSDDRAEFDASAPTNRTLWNASSDLASSALSRSDIDDVNGINGVNRIDGVNEIDRDEESVNALAKNLMQTPQIEKAVIQLSDRGNKTIISLASELRGAKTQADVDAVQAKSRSFAQTLEARREDDQNNPNLSPGYKRQLLYVNDSLQKTNNSLLQMTDKNAPRCKHTQTSSQYLSGGAYRLPYAVRRIVDGSFN